MLAMFFFNVKESPIVFYALHKDMCSSFFEE